MYGGCSGDVRGLFKNSNSINHTEESITSQNPFPIHWKCMGGMLTLSFSFPLGRRKGSGVMSGPPGIHELNFSRKSEGIEPVLLLNGIFVFYPPGIHDPLHRHTSVRWPYKSDESFMNLDVGSDIQPYSTIFNHIQRGVNISNSPKSIQYRLSIIDFLKPYSSIQPISLTLCV